ncbi:MAG: hypothetical protein GOU99_02200 [Candidatus Altiarchaeota archaeon]|nr:hypothetical protein [Candidatus Altiarchaeota archaeon]
MFKYWPFLFITVVLFVSGFSVEPKWFDNSINDTAVYTAETVEHRIRWTDDVGLRYSLLETNGTGASCDSWGNLSSVLLTGVDDWSNLSWTIPAACSGKTIGWRIYANNTGAEWNRTDSFAYEVLVRPSWSDNSSNSTAAGFFTEHNLYWQSLVGLAGYVFSFDNCTGNLVNNSWAQLTGAGNWTNVTKLINQTDACTIRWQVFANDTNNEWNSSDIFSYQTELFSDLIVRTIVFNESSPKEGEAVLIQANISNNAWNDLTSVGVWFNTTDCHGSASLIENFTLDFDGLSWKLVNTSSSFAICNHSINVTVIQLAGMNDLNQSDNHNTTELLIPSWSYFYGQILGGFTLSDPTSNFSYWYPSSVKGKLFTADSDSSINFSALQPLNGTNDFSEIDTELGSGDFPDSVSKTYDTDDNDQADMFENFTVFDRLVQNVPVVNTSNGSPWLTGILWDSSDGGTEYNGSQDIIFVVKVLNDLQGAFGINDYELRLPALLGDMMGASSLIDIYLQYD